LFKARDYNLDTKSVQSLKGGAMCKITIEDKLGNKIMCLILDGADHFSEATTTVFEDGNLKDTSSNKKNFIKTILQHGRECHARQILLVSDSITAFAIKEMSISSLNIVHFDFLDTNASKINKHVNQATKFRKLTPSEKLEFQRKHPRYKPELAVFSTSEALIKFYGYENGDIVTYIDHDPDTGPVVEFAQVVEYL
jgi:hypothetical protein